MRRTFLRLGLWQESISSKHRGRSIRGERHQEHRGEPALPIHALDFLNYSYLQSGQQSKAAREC